MATRLLDGSGEEPAERHILRAGPLLLDYEPGWIRSVRLGDVEIVRAVYAAVRDHNWGTVPGVLRDVVLNEQERSFDLQFTSEHEQGGIAYIWHGRIIGSEDGTVRFTFDGEAKSAFRRNRIGFCVLHPMDVAGMPCELEHIDDSIERSAFPKWIAPHQPFYDLRAIRHEVRPGLVAEVRMEGDTFETEDQRNWTDASFKTYCTPLGKSFPVEVSPGERVQQAITLRLIGEAPAAELFEPPLAVRVGSGPGVPIPPIGLGWVSGVTLSERERAQLAALAPSHLRVELVPGTAIDTLHEAADAAHACSALLEIAVHLGADYEADLRRVAAAAAAERPPIARWLIFRDGEISTRLETVQAAHAALDRFGAPLGAGTDAFFTELNRNRPPADLLDWVCFSNNPQVHAFDNGSLIETLAAEAATVESARQFSGHARIAVSPVTLKMRWNPNATAAEPPSSPGVLPRRVDPRQMSLFGAAWTLGCLRALLMAGADSITLYEITGWLGVMERDGGSPLPEVFPSLAGGVFPLYHVLADVLEFAGGEAIPSHASAPLTAEALVLRKDGQFRVLAANYTPNPQVLTVEGVSGTFRVRVLDETTADFALRDPSAFRTATGNSEEAGPGGLRLTLRPYATLCCDLSSTKES